MRVLSKIVAVESAQHQERGFLPAGCEKRHQLGFGSERHQLQSLGQQGWERLRLGRLREGGVRVQAAERGEQHGAIAVAEFDWSIPLEEAGEPKEEHLGVQCLAGARGAAALQCSR